MGSDARQVTGGMGSNAALEVMATRTEVLGADGRPLFSVMAGRVLSLFHVRMASLRAHCVSAARARKQTSGASRSGTTAAA